MLRKCIPNLNRSKKKKKKKNKQKNDRALLDLFNVDWKNNFIIDFLFSLSLVSRSFAQLSEEIVSSEAIIYIYQNRDSIGYIFVRMIQSIPK